jgi:hypothetical protein
MTLTEKLSHLRAINLEALFDDSLKENEGTILDMNRGQMYDEGTLNVESPGKVEHYAESTIRAKKRAPFNKTEFITLRWMGDFYNSLKLIIFKDKFVITSDDRIWGNFLETQDRFGKTLGMTEKSKGELREIMRDELIQKIRNAL